MSWEAGHQPTRGPGPKLRHGLNIIFVAIILVMLVGGLMDEFMTVAQTAAELGLTPVGVRARLEHGLMRGIKVHPRLWLIPKSEVERWRAIGRVQGKRRHQQPPREAGDEPT